MNTALQPPPIYNRYHFALASIFSTFIIPLLCILPLVLNSCDEPEPEPYIPIAERPENFPAITTQGLGTFGCFIDGKPYIGGAYPWTQLTAEYNNGLLRIYSRRHKIEERFMSIDIYYTRSDKRIFSPGTYELKFKDLAKDGYAKYAEKTSAGIISDSDYYYSDTTNIGKLTIFRLDNRIVSGQFEFDAYNKAINRRVKISDGRFDIMY